MASDERRDGHAVVAVLSDPLLKRLFIREEERPEFPRSTTGSHFVGLTFSSIGKRRICIGRWNDSIVARPPLLILVSSLEMETAVSGRPVEEVVDGDQIVG